MCLCHPCLAIGLIVINPAIVPVCRTANQVNDYQDDYHNNVNHRDLPPTLLEASQHTSFARVTGIAELFLIIVPLLAVNAAPHRLTLFIGPIGLVAIGKAALSGRLAATRLYIIGTNGIFVRRIVRLFQTFLYLKTRLEPILKDCSSSDTNAFKLI